MTTIVRIIALCVAVLLPSVAFAQQYPSKPVKIIIPFAAGGVTDIAGRVIAAELSKRLGQQFYIENQGGAGGNLGMGNAARSPGDGYTILFASSSIVVNPSLYHKLPFDLDKDFIPVTKAGGSPNAWLVNPNFPAKTVSEMVSLIRKEPGKHSVASPGTGTTPSLSIEMLRHDLGTDPALALAGQRRNVDHRRWTNHLGEVELLERHRADLAGIRQAGTRGRNEVRRRIDVRAAVFVERQHSGVIWPPEPERRLVLIGVVRKVVVELALKWHVGWPRARQLLGQRHRQIDDRAPPKTGKQRIHRILFLNHIPEPRAITSQPRNSRTGGG